MTLHSSVRAETISSVYFKINQISVKRFVLCAQIRRSRLAIPFNVRALRIDQLCLEPFRHDLFVVRWICSEQRTGPPRACKTATRALSCFDLLLRPAVVEPNETTLVCSSRESFPRMFQAGSPLVAITNVALQHCFLFERGLAMAVPVSKLLVALALAAWVSVGLVEISAQETPAQTASPAIAGTLSSLERAAGV